MRAQEAMGEPVKYALFIVVILVLMVVLLRVFMQAPDLSELVGMAIEALGNVVFGGIRKYMLKLTTIG